MGPHDVLIRQWLIVKYWAYEGRLRDDPVLVVYSPSTKSSSMQVHR